MTELSPTLLDPPASDPDEGRYHYHVMRRAIEAVDATPQASLDELSAAIGLSPAHFQRIFSAWAGISPKRLGQYLALGHAKALLSDRFTTLETAHSVGLSGSSRLHDLFLRWEAMSPGDYARGGEGLVIREGWFQTPFGEGLALATDRGLCGLAFSEETGREAAIADMRARWPKARFVPDRDAVAPFIDGLFDGGEARLHLIGAPFQIKVWEALMRIPSGHVTTYSEVARAIGHPKAVRAVGTAVGRNPVSYLIPCHRALRKSGGLGGYHWGLPVKRAILAWEAARLERA
ncbi:methylated-DNA--[protein]-cysteine S-methyltransferase [Jannaschia aquimarina]|uniref:methylated-DNA--[protein]-cysteine S-methyltransferase n=1 Tax=Jannaschia aquimarina TaxID=935700 RepID=A0A0D1EGU0_9RHOB|nr:bifunctional helix-turn-helix domain-containing protein/methylated-DNA--[protein]-cysteine S-methyltransferase [Jannaschia aquimarina]KIT15075.1 Bifunctional transcriptional activator/DNA repair enzyme Ada [Jannaschia aquimarina]SNS63392.1 AraC family transcriptional regulator, regulatory protein of adaptative response / methylated-DNA-[protein]-cysteine methyltransferase [Jannaschia aquimarina]